MRRSKNCRKRRNSKEVSRSRACKGITSESSRMTRKLRSCTPVVMIQLSPDVYLAELVQVRRHDAEIFSSEGSQQLINIISSFSQECIRDALAFGQSNVEAGVHLEAGGERKKESRKERELAIEECIAQAACGFGFGRVT